MFFNPTFHRISDANNRASTVHSPTSSMNFLMFYIYFYFLLVIFFTSRSLSFYILLTQSYFVQSVLLQSMHWTGKEHVIQPIQCISLVWFRNSKHFLFSLSPTYFGFHLFFILFGHMMRICQLQNMFDLFFFSFTFFVCHWEIFLLWCSFLFILLLVFAAVTSSSASSPITFVSRYHLSKCIIFLFGLLAITRQMTLFYVVSEVFFFFF